MIKSLIKTLGIAVVFYVIQMLLEIVINLFFDYTGIIRSEDFSENSFFIENLAHLALVIFITKLILSWLYFLIFVLLRFNLKSLSNGFVHLFAIIGSSLTIVFYDNDFPIIINFFIKVILACVLIVICEKLFHFKRN